MSKATERHTNAMAALRRAVLETPGSASLDERAAAESATPTGTAADGYLEKVRHASYRIVDADIDSLKAAGMAEDAIFELTLAAALGEATRSFERSARALVSAEAAAASPASAGAHEAGT